MAVDKTYQNRGVGKRLIAETAARLGQSCKIILLSAPAAVAYYPRIGFARHDQAWVANASDFAAL